MKKWNALILLSVAQFVMILDSTVMNVSISTVVKDLHTDINSMQMAITFYALTMASLMLIGGKLGSIFGRKRMLIVGCMIYGLGSLVTALSPNVTILIIGWSVIEGIGAALVVPALTALVATNYKGSSRIVAYATLGAVSGVAAAAGPLIGGFVTTFFSWRYVFLAEVLIMVLVLLFNKMILDSDDRAKEKIDIPSALLSICGFMLLVYGMLQSKVWGWVIPLQVPEVQGMQIAPFGLSIVVYFILVGIILLKVFYDRQRKLEKANRNPLLKVSMLSISQLRGGLSVLTAQYIVTASIFFVIPIYLQITLGYDALKTGLEILPLSAALIVFSVVGTRLSSLWSTRNIVRFGQAFLILGAFMLIASISVDLRNGFFLIGMGFIGAGLGLLASQLGNVIMSAVPQEDSAQAGGLQGVAQNLGSSLGTALIGSFLVAALTTSFVTGIEASTLPPDIKSFVQNNATSMSIVPVSEVSAYAESKGLSASEIAEIAQNYTQSQLDAIKIALIAVVVLGVFSLMISRQIPRRVKQNNDEKERMQSP